jgi:CRP-like cAMP-binding protein
MAADLGAFYAVDPVILASMVISFIAGAVGMIVYSRFRSGQIGKASYRIDESVVEAIVSEYSRRLHEYERAMADMRVRLDIMEMRAAHGSVTGTRDGAEQTSSLSGSQGHDQSLAQESRDLSRQSVSEVAAVTQHLPGKTADGREEIARGNGTTDYILKMLSESPRTSREIQHAVGRTREHTSRLMKKLYAAGLVARDPTVKPFRYNITEAGQSQLRKKAIPQVTAERQVASASASAASGLH